MPASTKIKGVALFLELGDPGEQYECDVTACTITNDEAEGGVATFCEVNDGGDRDFKLNLTAIQSTDSDSLWSYIWDNTGEEVDFTYAPHGNDTPTKDQPHFTGTVIIGPKPEIGGEAGKTNTYVFETQWDIIGTPTLDRPNGGGGQGD